MAESYDRERQNNDRLDELSAKVSALRGVTVDIYDSSRAHEVIDSTVCTPSPSPRAVYSLHYIPLLTISCVRFLV